MSTRQLPAFPYGAVYFRKSNPPKQDWARDYATASEDGMTAFRHWFLWSAVEIEPGRYDWDDYDRQLDLAAENGIKTVIAEFVGAAPEWAYHHYRHARYEKRDGTCLDSGMSGSCVTGGFPGLCVDNDDFRAKAGEFLGALASRYRNHPGMGWYDICNEVNLGSELCYCGGTAARFRKWLRAKYRDLRTLGEAWFRHSFADWDHILPPRDLGPYPHVMDWLEFRVDNTYEMVKWRADVIRAHDPDNPITAHGVAASLTGMAKSAADDWRAAAEVESYGYTWGSSRHGDEPWKQFHAVDLVRAASRGKPFWHAEAYAGPLWLQGNVLNKPRDQGRIAVPEDVRYWDLLSFMCGATGLMYLRWRPLLDGPLFGAFGAYAMDGSRTDRSVMVSRVAKWVADDAQADLWRSRPVRGEVGIVYVPETQIFNYAQRKDISDYSESMRGAYRGFFHHNIQADWVHISDIDAYELLYLPLPYMLNASTAALLRGWVERGGTLVCEGCPAYFGDRGHVGTVQPNLGLDELFGARESYVEFTPDLLGDLELNLDGAAAPGAIFLQAYETTSGKAVGWYADGRVAAVDHEFGEGHTRLIGTMMGAGYFSRPGDRLAAPFVQVLSFGAAEQHVRSSDSRIKARLHDGDGGTYLWIANPVRADIPVRLRLGEGWGEFGEARTLWGAEARVAGSEVELVAGSRDVCVLALSR